MTLLEPSTASVLMRLFTCITSNRRHLLHSLLPPQQEQHCLLRKRSHGYKLPEHTSSLNDSNFLTRMLYKKTLTDLTTFVDIFLYILIFIVWLRFVNHLLNYYLLTYLHYHQSLEIPVVYCFENYDRQNF